VSTPPEKAEILARYESAVDLVRIVARQVRRAVGSAVGVGELESCGNEGLLDAARRFDPSRHVPFRSYAYLRIRGAVLDGVRAIMPLPRRTWERLRGLEAMHRVSSSLCDDRSGVAPPDSAAAADLELAEHLATMATALALGIVASPANGELRAPTLDDEAEDPEQATVRAEQKRDLERAISELPCEEAMLIRKHYLEGQRLDCVAEELGLSKSWASRLHRRAIERLTKLLEES